MAYCGRTDIVDHILKRALDLKAGYRQNLALVGPPLIGKSTILQRSVEALRRHPPLLPIYLELRPGTTAAQFAEQFASTLLYRYWASDGDAAPHTFDTLARQVGPYIPRTVDLLAKAVAKARRPARFASRNEAGGAALSLLFEAPAELRRESGRLCVIMLDEFHRLAAWGENRLWTALGQQIMVQQDTMYLLASSEVEEARRILRERLAILFGHFELIPVGPFDLATGVRFLSDQAPLAELGPAALIAMADLAEGQPFVLDNMARALKAVGVSAGQRAVPALSSAPGAQDPAEMLGAALEPLLAQPTGVLAQQCHEAIVRIPPRRRDTVLPVLLEAACGQHRLGAMAKATGLTPAAVSRAVRTLSDAGLLVRHGVFACVANRLLRVWLKAVYRVQQGPVHVDQAAVGRALVAELRELVGQATAKSPQAILELVADLMRRFRHELVELHGRRVRLPALDVHTLLLPGIPRAVVGRQQESSWLCVPYQTMLREADAVALVQTLRSVAKPWGRRIVVALDGLELNARLCLQEQRFWVWELDDLNRLLEFYGLPRVLPTALQELAPLDPMLHAGGPHPAFREDTHHLEEAVGDVGV